MIGKRKEGEIEDFRMKRGGKEMEKGMTRGGKEMEKGMTVKKG